MDISAYEKRGYLLEEFHLFHLCDTVTGEIGYHYHEFHKLVLFISGKAAYVVEGRRYILKPGDIVLVGRGLIHRPEIESGTPYERIVIYISPDFLRSHSSEDCSLEACFLSKNHFLRPISITKNTAAALVASLESAAATDAFGRGLLCRSLIIQLLIEAARGVPERKLSFVHTEAGDTKTMQILQYINTNLTDDIPISGLAEKFYISKYHMMRRFRAETGLSIHGYISEKRLLIASDLIQEGASLTEACYRSGFRNYSTFSRAFKKLFGFSPGGRGSANAVPQGLQYGD